MYFPRQPAQSRPHGATSAGQRDQARGSLLNAGSSHGAHAVPPRGRRGETPGSLLAAAGEADWRQTAAPQARGSRFLPGLPALGALDIDDFIDWCRDGWKWIVAAILLGSAAALVYALTTTHRFTVYTDILIDPANLNVVTDDIFASSLQRDAQLMEVESKLRVLTSRNVLARVIEKLRLTEDAEFVRPDPLAPFKALIGIEPPEAGDRAVAAMRALGERVDARREERSFVAALGVWSEDPAKAMLISNAIVASFEEELFDSAAESAGRLAENLTERLDELRQNATRAERRVEEFRRANGLQSANGELVSNQLSAELNTQVLDAQQRLIQAQSRFDQMSTAIARGQAASASVFDSEAMTGLRVQRNTLQQQIGPIERTYGPQHPRMISVLAERRSLDEAMAREARRILELARAELTREQAAHGALRAKADEERANVFTGNDALVQLRDLERDARARAAVYETYLARAQQAGERRQVDATNIRVISPPVPPQARSWPPRTLLLLAAGAIGGAIFGTSMALVLGLWGVLRTPARRPDGRARAAAA